MGLGPFYSYRNDADLGRLMAAVRDAGVSVTPDTTSSQAFWFRRGLGLVHGSGWHDVH